MADELRIFVLGGFRAQIAGRPVADDAWRRSGAAALVKLLAVTPGHRMHREQLIDILWPDLEPAAGTRRLSKALHFARRALTGGQIRLQGDLLSLEADDLWVDLDAFEHAAYQGDTEAALALYTGDLLPENRFDQWAEPPRAQARTTAVRLLHDQGIHRQTHGDHRGAATSFERLVDIDPVHEEAYAHLMRLAASQGQRHIAVRWYGRLVENLREELGIEPNEELRHLYANIVSGQLAPTGPAAAPRDEPVHYAVSDGLHIAYQVTGRGSRDIVLVAGFVSHLELDWAEPRHAAFLDRLGTSGRLIRFDKRGTGMSDRPNDLPDLATRMHDVLAVMDAAGSRRAVLFGYSEGGPMAILMAAMHPERVEALVLYGAYAKRLRSDDYPWAPTVEARRQYVEQLAVDWSWEADMRIMCPSADDVMARWWGRRARAAATPSTVRSLIAMNSLIDVRNALGAVRVPTLVMHRRGDRDSRVDEGRYLAEHIPGARFVELAGGDHFVAVNADQILDHAEAFLAGLGPAAPPPRALGAVLAVVGPGSVAGLLSAGRPAQTPDGQTVIVYDHPAAAIRDALSVLGGPHGTGTRLGLQIADVPRTGPVVDGPGVEVAIGLAERAASGQLLVSPAVRDLVAGSGLSLVSAGEDAYRPTTRTR